MFITHSYLGTTRGPYRCLFFLLLEDYIQAQSQFVRELDLELERFARNLGDSAPLVKSFAGDIDATRTHVLDKHWDREQSQEISKTPGMLMINEDFDVFDPREHPWIYLHLGEKMYEGVPGAYRVGELLNELALIVRDSDKDIFREVHNLQHQLSIEDATSVFEAKPGIFGFSVDLVRGAEALRTLFHRLRPEY